MTPEETGKLLGICAAYDRRTVGEIDVLAWYRVLGELPYGACETAVIDHYSDSREWIMPADIRKRVKREQRELAERGRIRELLDADTYHAQVAAADSIFMRKLAARTGSLAIKAVPEADYDARSRP